MRRDGIVLRDLPSQQGLGEPIVEGNASRKRFKAGSPDGVLVTTTFDVGSKIPLS